MIAGIQTIQGAEGRIDVLVNNAGFGSFGAIEEVNMADAHYQLEVNVFGAARLMQLVIPGIHLKIIKNQKRCLIKFYGFGNFDTTQNIELADRVKQELQNASR